jgi:hypothetical protein
LTICEKKNNRRKNASIRDKDDKEKGMLTTDEVLLAPPNIEGSDGGAVATEEAPEEGGAIDSKSTSWKRIAAVDRTNNRAVERKRMDPGPRTSPLPARVKVDSMSFETYPRINNISSILVVSFKLPDSQVSFKKWSRPEPEMAGDAEEVPT